VGCLVLTALPLLEPRTRARSESIAVHARRGACASHPSVFTFFISSDQMPPPTVEAAFRDALSAQVRLLPPWGPSNEHRSPPPLLLCCAAVGCAHRERRL